MKITVTVDQPTGDFQDRLLALLAEHAATVEIDTTWTIERAERYYRSLPARAQRIVKEAAIRDGYVPAEDLRDNPDDSLRGHSGALSRALTRGATRGDWPSSMTPPIEPQGPGFGKVVGYRMPDNLVGTFFAAIKNTDASGSIDLHDISDTVDKLQAFGDAHNAPILKRAKTKES
ncbi:hypothetical protein [Streptomyces sp. OspMP-M43]|uniref:hypothetical protein n=1 Tax=Streptomyces sp. OspMP-M43 TaxID=1839781 RepID=UPI00081BB575|nr:hypothetical protein [Streptomyces sp. OspMP-M43]SCD66076.1 hypothetical protein GA0115261_1012313 [Streptomyces sp. OspMP-M43]